VDLGVTDRQLDVLALIVQGKNNKLICQMLNLAEPKVTNHVTAILKALKVYNRTEAEIAVNELGWNLPSKPWILRRRWSSIGCPSMNMNAPTSIPRASISLRAKRRSERMGISRRINSAGRLVR
jgi:DNA-binding CsgD family transcriptional regulator